MAEAARIAAGEGADIIDINMGCPAKKVTGGYAGSALMRDLDHALSLIEAVIGAVDVPVTVKMRLGWDEGALNAPLLARRAEQAGVQMVTVHGRTRCQFYQGKADWRAIARVKQAVSIPVVANGDVDLGGRCRADARTVRRRRGDGRPRAITARRGRLPRSPRRAGAAAAQGIPQALKNWRTMWSPTTRTCYRSTASKAACGRPASISAGISTATPPSVSAEQRRAIMTGRPAAKRDRRVARSVRRASRQPAATEGRRMNVTQAATPAPADAAQIVLNTIRHPVIMIGADRFHHLRQRRRGRFLPRQRDHAGRHTPEQFVPFGSPLLTLVEQVRERRAPVNEYRVDISSPRLGVEKIVDLYVAPVPELPGSVVVMFQERSMADKIDRQMTHRGAARSVTGLAAMLAHEIKNPLSGIRGAAQLLETAVLATRTAR